MFSRHPDDDRLSELLRWMREVRDVTQRVTSQLFASSMRFIPPVDIYDQGDSFLVVVVLPGIIPDSLKVEATKDAIFISGERRPDPPGDGLLGEPIYQANLWGPFHDEISLPEEVDPKSVRALLKAGVLYLEVSKLQGARKVEIE